MAAFFVPEPSSGPPACRYVDKIPTPENPKDVEVVVISLGRTGTLSLHTALGILGYSSYHLYNTFTTEGVPHMKIMYEAMRAKHFHEGKPYGREEFDKWFANYNALTDVPGYLAEEMIEAYPDAKFILTTRDFQPWLRSLHNTIRARAEMADRFPMSYLRYIEPYSKAVNYLGGMLLYHIWRGKGAWDDDAAYETYKEHNAKCLELIPPEKLLVVRLEDGLDWEKICPFLGKDIPDVPYPKTHTPAEFQSSITRNWTRKLAISAAKAVLWASPVVVAGTALYYRKRLR